MNILRNKLQLLERFDYLLLFCVTALTTIGIFFIYSSGINSNGVSVSGEYVKQIIFASTGFILMISFALFDYRKLKRFIPTIFGGYIIILLYTLFFGKYVNGARSWLGIGKLGVQPSEFGKIIYILCLAWYLDRSTTVSAGVRYFYSALILGMPVLLILAQPDMGTASVYIPIFLTMLFVADIPLKYIIVTLSIGVLSILFTVLPVWYQSTETTNFLFKILTASKLRFIVVIASTMIAIIGFAGLILYKLKIYSWLSGIFGVLSFSLLLSTLAQKVLKDYQIKRLIVFVNPDIDPLGSGWNIIQSKIAIGSGGIFGQGFLKGTQSHYQFLPQQSTDFIFGILAEEIGFLGSLFVFLLFLTIFFRILYLLRTIKNTFGYYIGVGILTMFFFHFVVNVGMVMGIMPITGIPLTFLSYGGSSLWTAMISVGILMNINFRRLDF